MRLFYRVGELNVADIMEEMSLSRSSSQRLLNKLIENGYVKRLGSGPSSRYAKVQVFLATNAKNSSFLSGFAI